ncbi:MAG: hypothetical protein H8E44_48250 [Planctomycetes bacterium]|nr:hypothetical protein [Planctomycetota bacterium]MBL7038478.1 hypothetical protein [Pirellulaceae bacterium]
MARAEIVDSWATAVAPDEVRQRIERLCASHKVRIAEALDGKITGKQGSQFLTRLLGGWFVGPATLPKLVAIHWESHESGCKVDVRIEEAMGFGVMDAHFKSRYEEYFVEFVSALKRELPPLESGQSDIVAAEVIDPPADPTDRQL